MKIRRSPEPPDREVGAIVRRAWQDNVEVAKLGYAAGWARAVFNDKVGAFVREHYRRRGKFPVGWHRVQPRSKVLWFRPVRPCEVRIPEEATGGRTPNIP